MTTSADVILCFEQLQVGEIAELVAGLSQDDLVDVEEWARHELRACVRPLHLRAAIADESLTRRHRALLWLVAELAARLGRNDELLELLFGIWRDDFSNAARLVETLIDVDRSGEAAVIAHMALHQDVCVERDRIDRALESICAPPDGWRASLEEFARAPSVEAWRELMQFTPDGFFYARTREAMRVLMAMNVDGNILFECATDIGTTPDAIQLVEEGKVDPDVVLERSRKGTVQSRGLWIGLAARAAYAQGDRFRAVRLLRDAYRRAHPDWPPIADAMELVRVADDELRAMLDKAGFRGAATLR